MTPPSSHNTGKAAGWSPLASRLAINGPLGFSLAAVALTAIFLLMGLATLIGSAFGRGTGDAEPKKELDKLVALHNDSMKNWQDQFNGRSVFFKPLAPIPPAPPPPKNPPPPVIVDPGPPPIDPVYRGPSISFAYADTVYFNPATASDNVKYLRIRVGEEKSGIKVISCNLPWSVKVAYKGGEYDVKIFDKNAEDVFLSTTAKPIILTRFLLPLPGSEPPAPVNAEPALGAEQAGETAPTDEAPPRESERQSRSNRQAERPSAKPVEAPKVEPPVDPVDVEPQPTPENPEPQPAPTPDLA